MTATLHHPATCDNRRTIRRAELEDRVLSGLRDQPLHPDLIAEFVRASHEEFNRLASSRQHDHGRIIQDLAQIERQISNAKPPREFVFHGLRHTYASDLVRQGIPLEVITRQLGHADVKTVTSTYGHLAEQFRKEQIRTRFSPLSEEQQSEASRRGGQLDTLWYSVQSDSWWSYGAKQPSSQGIQQSRARTSNEVINAFPDSRVGQLPR